MKKIVLFFFLLKICNNTCCAQTTNDSIAWQQTIIINNEAADKNSKRSKLDSTKGFGKNYDAQYARLLKLTNKTWLAAYTVSVNKGYLQDSTGGLQLQVSKSTDNGRHWIILSSVKEPGRDVDNAQLIQLKDGSVLLACRSIRWQESYRLHVYKSIDNGKNWKFLSVIDANEGEPGTLGHPDKGIYEPHFYLLDNGKISVMYANEKHVTENPSYSQIISQKISDDGGKTWGKEIWVAYEQDHPLSRPGMPVWTRMKNGNYIVVYEICGPEHCDIYYKCSKDGFNWPVGLGTAVPNQLGAPYIISLSNGNLAVTSNSSNISVSNDYGLHWQTVNKAFNQSLWPALYDFSNNVIGAVSAEKRPEGGHNIQIRLGNF